MSKTPALRKDGKSEPVSALDERWLDEYAKRGLLTSSYGAISNGYFWGIGSIAGTLALKKIAKEHVSAHPVKTPLNLAGIAILGYLVACFTQDQVTQKNRMRAERLARRMVTDAEAAGSGTTPQKTSMQEQASSPVKWREVLRPGWLGSRFPAEDRLFEKRWYYKLLSIRLKRTFFGASHWGSFVAALTFASGKLIAYAGNELVDGTPAEGGKGVAYHKLHTPAATALMMAVGLVALYKFEQQNTKEKMLDDNYIARQVARRKGNSSPITRTDLALNTGEALRGKGKEAEKMAAENGQWFRKYLTKSFKFSFFNELSKATFLGMFANFSTMLLKLAARKEVSFHGARTPLVFAGMMGFGGLCAYVACNNDSKLVKMSDDRLAELMKDKAPGSGNAQAKPDAGNALNQAKPGNKAAPPSDFKEYDRKWLRDFRTLLFQEALCLALASATFFGMFTKASNMRLDHVAGKKIYFDKLRSPLAMGGMAAAGIGITYVANTKTAMLQKLEDDRLGFRVNAPEDPAPRQAPQKGMHEGAAPPENFQEYDKKWLARYRNQAFQKGLYDAIANAAFFGMFTSMSTLLLDKVGGKPMAGEFSPTRSPLAMGGMMGIGTVFAYMGQAKGASIKKLHSDRLAYRVKAEEEQESPGKAKEKNEVVPGRRSANIATKKPTIPTAFPALIVANPDLSYWQTRVKDSRNPTQKTYGLCA